MWCCCWFVKLLEKMSWDFRAVLWVLSHQEYILELGLFFLGIITPLPLFVLFSTDLYYKTFSLVFIQNLQ